jgi:hypothetical protein
MAFLAGIRENKMDSNLGATFKIVLELHFVSLGP